jgi:hypothetical protein
VESSAESRSTEKPASWSFSTSADETGLSPTITTPPVIDRVDSAESGSVSTTRITNRWQTEAGSAADSAA